MPLVEQLDWVDSIGLSVLHYAILLKQEQLVEELLEKKIRAIKVPFSDGEAELLYDYTVLACYKNISNRRSVFQKTSKVVAAQSRSRKALERRLWLKRRKLDIQNASIQKAKELIHTARKNGLNDKVKEPKDSLYLQLYNQINALVKSTRKNPDQTKRTLATSILLEKESQLVAIKMADETVDEIRETYQMLRDMYAGSKEKTT